MESDGGWGLRSEKMSEARIRASVASAGTGEGVGKQGRFVMLGGDILGGDMVVGWWWARGQSGRLPCSSRCRRASAAQER